MKALICSVLLGFMLCLGTATAEIVKIAPGDDAQTAIQEALILAEEGDVVELAAGTYALTMGLSLDVDHVTLRGAGMDKTILDFTDQDAGSEGLLITSDRVVVEGFSIQNAAGNAFKSNGCDFTTFRNVKAEWTGGPKPTNGAYGLYPVSSTNVLIEGCVAIGASDAGIYVGQSKNIIVRDSRVEYNVAGLEIENCHGADVYNCVATNNTGGLLVFDLPGLPQQKGHDVRFFNNKIYDNDTPNFAPPGNIVGTLSRGTGVMVMSNSRVEIFGNEIRGHRTYNVVICSYYVSNKKIRNRDYYPYPENVYIYDNTFGRCGWEPTERVGKEAAAMTGLPLPDILWDGITNKQKIEQGELPRNANIIIGKNTKLDGELTFANLNANGPLTDADPDAVTRDLNPHKGEIVHITPIAIEGT